MMSKKNPWGDIKTPPKDLNTRKVKGANHLPLSWGKDNAGRCVFVMELKGDHIETFNKNSVLVNGIKTELRLLDETGNQVLVITLEKHIDQDLFASLCDTLVEALIEISDSAVGLSVALSQIKRWKIFLSGRRPKMLTAEQVRGLFSELVFIQNMLHEDFSEMNTLEAWQGPEESHQDFIFSNTAVEIKSLSGRERNTIRISSEDQLEGVNDNLFLRVFRLIDIPKSEKSVSLNGLVGQIEESLKNADAIEEFTNKLAKAGYVELRDYDIPKLIVAEERTYRVTEAFPRLIRSELSTGITKVSYEIKLEAIESFECDNQNVWNK